MPGTLQFCLIESSGEKRREKGCEEWRATRGFPQRVLSDLCLAVLLAAVSSKKVPIKRELADELSQIRHLLR